MAKLKLYKNKQQKYRYGNLNLCDFDYNIYRKYDDLRSMNKEELETHWHLKESEKFCKSHQHDGKILELDR
jgi:hypothetical protein